MDISKAASTLGKKGGKSTSKKKQEAARKNGKKGGYSKNFKKGTAK